MASNGVNAKARVLKKRHKKKGKGSYSIYIYKVLKQVHRDAGISSVVLGIVNEFASDIFERIATESAKLIKHSERKTLTEREIRCATRLLLPDELAKHAVSEGNRALP